MNKKQLTESIMAGVKRAFRENKSLNEGFSQWREQNVPRIDYDILKTNINNLSTVLEQLMGSKQIVVINVIYHSESSASWSTLAEIIAPAHMGQGSKVTYISHPGRRQPPSFLHAAFIAESSA